nr:myosin-6-like [Quercus suber]
MDNASLRDFRGGEGAYVADALERSLLFPADMAQLEGLKRQEVILSMKRYLGMAVQATYRLEEEANKQSRALEQERDNRLDATRVLNKSEGDLKKAKEALKEVTKARDRAVSGLAGAQKQAADQTRRLLDTKGQLQIAKEHIADLKQRLAETVGARDVAKHARNKALRAKAEAESAQTEAESSKEQAEEKAFAEGVAKTKVALKAQVPQATSTASKADTGLEATDEGQVEAAEDPTPIDRLAEGVEHQRVLEEGETSNLKVPLDVVKPPVGPQVPPANSQAFPAEGDLPKIAPPAKETAFLVMPLQAVPLGQSSEDLEDASRQPPKGE